VPPGLIMTGEIQQEIEDYLVSVKQNEVFNTAFDSWLEGVDLVYHEEVITRLTEEAASSGQSPEELPLEALPGLEDGEEAEEEAEEVTQP